MTTLTRRGFMMSSSAGLAVLGGCAGAPRLGREGAEWRWSEDEQRLIDAPRDDFDIVTRGSADARVLRVRARPVPDALDLGAIAARMENTMFAARGAGLAGPQVGLSIRVATVYLDHASEAPKLVFARNPTIVERADETMDSYEDCLSIPNLGGLLRRSSWVRVEYATNAGERVTTEADGFNAVIWQHEIDHLDGTLYVDRLVGDLMSRDQMHRLRLY